MRHKHREVRMKEGEGNNVGRQRWWDNDGAVLIYLASPVFLPVPLIESLLPGGFILTAGGPSIRIDLLELVPFPF